jgi:predicted CXXCH cytochrome family protein
MMRKTILRTLLFALLLLSAVNASGGSILNTRHNLSVSGPGDLRAAAEDRICIFCHTPHRAVQQIPYLWNRSDLTASYIPYQSSTLYASVGQPTGASKMCLSCHDGTIALGAMLSEPQEIPFLGGMRFIPAGRTTYLGTDLSDDHPISFVYNSSLALQKGELVDPSQLPPAVNLDQNQQLQCTACHNPHDDAYGKFLVMSNQYSDLCITCHQKAGWTTGSHATSNDVWNHQGPDPWPITGYPTVAENGCENCHRPHTAGRPAHLLKNFFEEDNCLVCHNGNVASKNIEPEFTKVSIHAVQDTTGVHDAAENFQFGSVPTHVECADCHNPHQANGDASPGAPAVSGANRGVTGIDTAGQQVPDAQSLYQICFKCHADNSVITSYDITRQIDQLNTRLELDPGNPSYHPVTATGVNPDVPSLIAPLTTNSMITCTDCHNNDDPGGPGGPHGSIFKPLLAQNYETLDYTTESSFNYALCYKCHSRNSILNDQSFKDHKKHIEGKDTPCSACHDPHGISQTQGNSTNNSNLINFDLTIVFPDGETGRLEFEDLGRFSGQCFLTCHGKNHGPKDYKP